MAAATHPVIVGQRGGAVVHLLSVIVVLVGQFLGLWCSRSVRSCRFCTFDWVTVLILVLIRINFVHQIFEL